MYKFMNNPYFKGPFMEADKGGTGGGAGDDDQGAGGDNPDAEDPDADDPPGEEKKFSQKEIDEAVQKRLAREKRKWQREQQKTPGKKDSDKDADPEEPEVKAAKDKATRLEVKVACYEAEVAKESVEDVAALAAAYMAADHSIDLEDAIEKVVKKYPQFKKGAADPYEDDKAGKGVWGQRQSGTGAKKIDPVEAAFLKRNPGLKID